MKILYYSPASYGGLSDYAHHQANALTALGADVTLLSTPKYPQGRGEKYQILPILEEIDTGKLLFPKILKALYFIIITLNNFGKLATVIEKTKFEYVLLGSYVEYLAPLWSGRLRQLAKNGTIFGAIVHDPVRDFVVGPLWWHRWSIACGYSFLREAFVHATIELDTVQPMPQLRTTVIPHGIYHFPSANQSREETRNNLDLPLDAKVILSFGHIRDNKNLDLVIQAMLNLPNVYLIVAGQESSSGQRPIAFYQDLAGQLGVAERCRWIVKFISPQEVANLFQAIDIVALTYSQNFRSASGVLNVAAHYQKPCIVSSGEGALYTIFKKYSLGILVEPDKIESIKNGIIELIKNSRSFDWNYYYQNNSWEENSKLIFQKLKDHQRSII